MYFNKRDKCPICSASELTELYSVPYSDSSIRAYLRNFYNKQGEIEFEYIDKSNFRLLKCYQCDFVFQNEVPNDFLLNKLYEEWIDPVIAKERNSKFSRIYYKEQFEELNMLIKYIDKDPHEIKIFDFGIGWANWAKIAKSFGCAVYGSEISENRKENAIRNGIIMINWEDIPKYEFDIINTEQVFEHLVNPKETLDYLCQSLNRKGIIKISVPNAYKIEKTISHIDWNDLRAVNVFTPLEHLNSFKPKSIIVLAKKCNLSSIDLRLKPWNIMHDSFLDLSIYLIKKVYRKVHYPGLKSTSQYFGKLKASYLNAENSAREEKGLMAAMDFLNYLKMKL